MEVRDSKGRFVSKSKDLAGNRYCRLVAIEYVKKENDSHAYWKCRCDCGNTVIVRKDSLENGHAKSCGCYGNDYRRELPCYTKDKLYKAWQSMKQRCNNPKCKAYVNYGGRGIKICKEWESFETFKEWSLENGYISLKGHNISIDRIDVNGDYEPTNCRWVGYDIQNYNKRCTVYVEINGEKLNLLEISQKYNLPLTTIRSRYRKYSKGLIPANKLIGA